MALNRDAIISSVCDGLGFADDLAEKALIEIRVVQGLLERDSFLPWFLLEWEQTVTTTAGSPLVGVPNGFLREDDDSGDFGGVRVSVGEGFNFLKKKSRAEELRNFQTTSGLPEFYAEIGEHFVLGPIPDQAYTLTIGPFYKAAESLEFETTNLWTIHASGYLEAALGKRMAFKYIKDVNIQNYYSNLFAEEKSRLMLFSEAKKNSGGAFLLGDDS